MIQGVIFKDLAVHPDDRGFFVEIIRNTDKIFNADFGQLSHSLVYHGVIKAWHYHKIQTQWNYVVNGLIKVALHDLRKDSPTYKETMEFLAGDNQSVRLYSFPPGVAHGYKCHNGPMNIIYLTSGIYDPNDEGRIPYDDIQIGYNWLNQQIR
jgi:dTDP-4-dehydrorhamnose 3,5-epimerase